VDGVHGADDVPDFEAEGIYAGGSSMRAVGVTQPTTFYCHDAGGNVTP
jgi:hypothetical protein